MTSDEYIMPAIFCAPTLSLGIVTDDVGVIPGMIVVQLPVGTGSAEALAECLRVTGVEGYRAWPTTCPQGRIGVGALVSMTRPHLGVLDPLTKLAGTEQLEPPLIRPLPIASAPLDASREAVDARVGLWEAHRTLFEP